MTRAFDFDIAISFAGEQREEARAIKNCLEKAGVTVFFDEDREAELWGKDLVVHLADVYEHRARYCLMLISEAYAERVWPNHEAQTALARAVTEKGEYILPVRFDQTILPGLRHTISYVSFQKHEAAGICRLILEKLGKAPNAEPASATVCRTSPYLYLTALRQATLAYVPVTEAEWSNSQVSFTLRPDDATDGPFLDSLRGTTDELLIAYKNNVGMGRVQDVRHRVKAGQDEWLLTIRPEDRDFQPPLELAFAGMSADQIAEQRARRLLLNEPPARALEDASAMLGADSGEGEH